MGVFMASIAFRRGISDAWSNCRDHIKGMLDGVVGLTDNLDSDGIGYAIVSPYGDLGGILAEYPCQISRLVDDYTVFTTCVDSDYAILELYKSGEHIETCSIGEVYDDYEGFDGIGKPNIDLWRLLLIDDNDHELLAEALFGESIFIEDQLRQISKLTGLPIFDDALVFGCEI